MIKQFDRPTCKLVQDEIVRACQEIAKRHGFSIAPAGGTMDGAAFTAKFRLEVTDPEAKTADERRKFEQYCSLFDLEPKHYGAAFKWRDRDVTLIGFEPNRAKFPLKCQSGASVVLLPAEAVAKIKIAVPS